MTDIEALAEKLNSIRGEWKAEIGESVKEVTTDLSTRIIRGTSSEAASRARQVGELGESVKVIASRVDGIQDTAARCKSDCSKLHQLFSDLHRSIGDKISRDDSEAESRRVTSSLQDIREQLQGLEERLGACERDSLAVAQGGSRSSSNPGPGPGVTVDAEARARITKECGNITRVVRLLATKMAEKDDVAKREFERISLSMEKMRDATKKLAEVIARAREETSQSTKLAERAIKMATDSEKSASVRVDRLTQEFTGVKRAVQDSIDEIKQHLECQGILGVKRPRMPCPVAVLIASLLRD